MSTLRDAKADLFAKLRTAFTLELGTIPPYMMAVVSAKRPHNRVAAEIIRTVMIEEMLHLTLVGNLTSALGGRVTVGPSTLPTYPLRMEFEGKRFRDRDFDVDLSPLSPASIDVYMKIELPDGWLRRTEAPAAAELTIQGLTIGDFYRNIAAELRALCEEHGQRAVFTGDPALQISEEFYWSSGGHPVVVTDLESALRAIEVIVEQGEGAKASMDDGDDTDFRQPHQVAHFYRFREIHFGRRYRPGDKPHQPPTGEPFEVDYQAVQPFKTNPRSTDYAPGSPLAELNTRFNREYTLMLIQIGEAFSGTPRTLYTAIRNGMAGLSSVAARMVETPIPGDPQGRHGAPTFEWQEPG
jgi:hypothetical protein